MAKPKELKFKPYVGHFFQFVERVGKNPRSAIIGKSLYGNSIDKRKKFKTVEEMPKSILVVDEKQNNVRFLSSDGEYYWTTKAQIEPIDLPTYEGNPIPIFEKIRDLLIYCTETRVADFKLEEMTKMAVTLLPKINMLINHHQISIVPK